MHLKYEPSSEPLHILAKQLFNPPPGAGNCSGHGACIDQAVTQWWSGSVRFPDLWALEAASLHLVRRDVGRPAANLGAERPVCINPRPLTRNSKLQTLKTLKPQP